MLAALCGRPRPSLLPSIFLFYAHAHAYVSSFNRLQLRDPPHRLLPRAASIWQTSMPSYWRRRRLTLHDHDGEGSWNVVWDARPARWLHHPDSAWLLFGVSASLATAAALAAETLDSEPAAESSLPAAELNTAVPCNYRVTGVVADGRCLFRAIAHMACLRKGEEVLDENHERELADELRAQVVEELLKRRKEVEWFIDEDFDMYVKRIEQPYVWGGEPELLMSSHILRTPISVYMKEQPSGNLINIANYGEEYRKNEENSINVLFHGYGHYDILETIPERGYIEET